MNDVAIKKENLEDRVKELKLIPHDQANKIKDAFVPMLNEMAAKEDRFNDIVARAAKEITPELMEEAKELRLEYVKVRTSMMAVKKKGKELVLMYGRAWDGSYNQHELAAHGKEDALKEIEKHREIEEAKKLAVLGEKRAAELSKYGVETDDVQKEEYARMRPEIWDNFILGYKTRHEEKIASDKKAEADRIERERREKIGNDRRMDILEGGLSEYIEGFKGMDFVEMDDGMYSEILNFAHAKKTELQQIAKRRAEYMDEISEKGMLGYFDKEALAVLGNLSESDFKAEMEKASVRMKDAEKKKRIANLEIERRKETSHLAEFIPGYSTIEFGTLPEGDYKKLIDKVSKDKANYDREVAIRKLNADRRDALREVSQFIDGFDNINFGEMTESAFEKLSGNAYVAKQNHEKEMAAQAEKVRKAEEAQKAKQAEDDRIAEEQRQLELAPDKEKIKNFILTLNSFIKQSTPKIKSKKLAAEFAERMAEVDRSIALMQAWVGKVK